MKKIRLKTIAYLLLLIMVLSQPSSTFQYAYSGLYQWAVKMVPTLFPFMMISSIMLYSGIDIELGRIISRLLSRAYRYSEYGLYAIFIGFLCGFPMGAKVVSELYENGKISRDEAESLLGFCNNIGPAYFLGIILPMLGECGFHNKLPFIFGMYGIPALYGVILSRIYYKRKNTANEQNNFVQSKPQSQPQPSLPSLLKRACLENTQSLILLGGYITFTNAFRVSLDFLPLSDNAKAIVSSLIEIIGGVQTIYLTDMTNAVKVLCIMTALCFGGVSCFLQASCFLEGSKLSLADYLKHKLIITAVSGLYYLILLQGHIYLSL